jgi:hypothetical protein
MATNVVFPSKNQLATVLCSFDFLSMLAASETLVSALVTVTIRTGSDPNPSAVLSGAASFAGKTVNQLVTGGVVGVIYVLTCSVVTSTGQDLVMNGELSIIDDNPYQ